MILNNLNGNYIKWEKDQHKCSLKNYNEIKDIIDKNSISICDIVNNYFLTKRIGTDSSYGLVYLIEINNIKFALKILPIINDESIKENKKEMEITEKMSKLVLNEKCENFPILYKYGYCKNFEYPYFSKFREKAENYAFSKEHITHTIHTPVNFMLLELAETDLYKYILKDIGEDELLNIGIQIFNAIICMHENNIIHNDLHPANILILKRDSCDLSIGITDFGLSIKKKTNLQNDIEEINYIFSFLEKELNDFYKLNLSIKNRLKLKILSILKKEFIKRLRDNKRYISNIEYSEFFNHLKILIDSTELEFLKNIGKNIHIDRLNFLNNLKNKEITYTENRELKKRKLTEIPEIHKLHSEIRNLTHKENLEKIENLITIENSKYFKFKKFLININKLESTLDKIKILKNFFNLNEFNLNEFDLNELNLENLDKIKDLIELEEKNLDSIVKMELINLEDFTIEDFLEYLNETDFLMNSNNLKKSENSFDKYLLKSNSNDYIFNK